MRNTRIKQAVILCGGFGTRIKHLTNNIPKPLLRFDRVKFLDYLLLNLFRYGFKKVILLCHYKSGQFVKLYHNKKIFDMKIQCVIEKTPLGTGGSLFNIKKKLDDIFLVCNGDTFIDFNIISFINSFKNKKIFVGLQRTSDNKYKKVFTKNKKILRFSTNYCKNNDLFNTGYVILRKDSLNFNNKKIFNLEEDFFNFYIKKKNINYFEIKKDKKFIDIGTPKDYRRASSFFKNKNKRFFLILDRDGIINFDTGYISDEKQVKFIKNIHKLVSFFNKLDVPIFVVTNQSGVGRGFLKEKKLNTINEKIKEYFYENNTYLNQIYYCPHHIDAKIPKYKKICKFRKPNNGFYKKIKKQWFLKSDNALMIGDKKSDMEFAKKSKISGILFDKPKQDIFKAIFNNKKIKNLIKQL